MALCIFLPSGNVKNLHSAFKVKAEEIVYEDSAILVCDIDHAPKTVSIYSNDLFFLASSYPFLVSDNPLSGKNSGEECEEIVRSILDQETTPQFGVLINKRSGRFVVYNDNLGLARAYNTLGHRYGSVVADNPILIAERFGRSVDWTPNFYTLVILAAIGWIPRDSTLINGVNQLPPGLLISGTSREKGARVNYAANGCKKSTKKQLIISTTLTLLAQ